MATITTKTHVCDRCGRKQEGQVGLDFDGGYLSMGPINGALSDHVGRRRNDEDHNADLCEPCRVEALRWWNEFREVRKPT